MPLYEYVCQECSHSFEALVFNGQKPRCPHCDAENLDRQLSVPARPKTETTPLPTACKSSGPPCGPLCNRWPNS
jgi:putative FmdB family regulatory protein